MVPETVKHFIGGRYANSTLRKSYGVPEPVNGKEYVQVEVGLAADINQAVLAARAALEAGPWPALSGPERARVLRVLADAIDARADDIAAAETLGTGLPVTQARERATQAGDVLRLAADQIPAGGSRPAGVAGLITSWRTPFLAQARAVAPALAAGCAVVLKPDEWAPLPAALLAEIAGAADLPDGVLNIVHGSLHRKAIGPQARDALITHPSVPRLSFTGEAVTGQEVLLKAITHGKKLSAEVAGNSTCLILADADLDLAIEGALAGAFTLNGQRRTATSTILAERSIYTTLVSRLAERAGRLRVGDPSDPQTQIGALPHTDHHDKVLSWVRLGLREGARLAAGGGRPSDLPEGSYLAATVLADVTPSMQIFTEAVCGPLVRVTPFNTDDEAVSLANAVTNPAAAYLWTGDLDRAHRLAPAIDSASIWINSQNPNDEAESVGIDFYTRSQTVFVADERNPR